MNTLLPAALLTTLIAAGCGDTSTTSVPHTAPDAVPEVAAPVSAQNSQVAQQDSNWDRAKDKSSEAWDASKEAGSSAWQATKETSSEAWDKTKSTSAQAWDTTKEKSGDVWDATKETSQSAWEATKSGTKSIADKVDEKLSGDSTQQ
ncbi:MAG: hypothetical protein OQL16_02830 [Gammaproteobacteria bacterium]|nr:hypothetical protein [Gammaproteobacteria bacterium]